MAIWQYRFLILPNKAYTDLSVEGDLGTPKDFDAKTLWMYDRFSPNQFNGVQLIVTAIKIACEMPISNAYYFYIKVV